MDDELKIIIKAILDENVETSINQQLKNLKLEPISLDIKVNSSLNKIAQKAVKEINDTVSRTINKNSLAKNLIDNFNIKNKLDRQKITKAVEEYQNALKIKNPDEIIKSYDNLFNSIKNSFYNLKFELNAEQQGYLDNLKNRKLYVSDTVKGDLGKDGYKYYRDNLIGKITRNSSEGLHPDVLYEELYDNFKGMFPDKDDLVNESDRFRAIADKYIYLRQQSKATFNDEDILWNIGSDSEIKESINKVIKQFEKVKPNIQRSIQNIKSSLIDESDLNFISLLENAPFDAFSKNINRKIKISFQIDISNPDELRDEMERIVSEFTNNKGNLVDYQVRTNTRFDSEAGKQIEVLSGATVRYKNELDEVITKELRWSKIGETLDENGKKQAIMGFAEAYTSYSQNIEKATQKQEKLKLSTEKLENKLREYKKSFENLQIKADKSGVELNSKNILEFNNAIDNKDLEKSRHLLTMLQKEWQGLNAVMVKDTPNTALENMNKYISKMSYSIEAVKLRLKNLASPSKELQDKVLSLKNQLENVYKSSSNEEKLSAYGKLKQSIIEVNAELSNQIKIQRQINQDKNLVYDKKRHFLIVCKRGLTITVKL